MKKILSLLTAAVLTSSSVASSTAFTTNTNTKLSKINKSQNLYGYKNATEHIQTIYSNIYNKYNLHHTSYEVVGTFKMRFFITKDNIMWAYGGRSWSHFFANLYTHIAFYHPEVGNTAGQAVYRSDDGNYHKGYIFDKNALDSGNNNSYCYSVFASDYWAWDSAKYDFMGDIDLDSHNGNGGGYHGVYADNLIRTAKSTPKDKNGISFQITFNLHDLNRSYQELDINSITYW